MAHGPFSPLPAGSPVALLGASLFSQAPQPDRASSHRFSHLAPGAPGKRVSPGRATLLAMALVAVAGAAVFAVSHTAAPTDPAAAPVPDVVLGSERYNDVTRMGEEMDALIGRLEALTLSRGAMREDRP